MSTRPATTSHRAPSTITSATSATLLPGPSGLWILPVLWKTRAIRSTLTAASQKARFPQHLGRRKRRPQAPQALSSVLSIRKTRVGSRRSVAAPMGGN